MFKLRTELLGLLAAASVVSGPAAADDALRAIMGTGAAIFLNEMERNRQSQQAEPPRQHNAAPRQAPRRAAPDPREAELRARRMEVQRRLNALGFDAGPVDGIYGARTRGAIAAFQHSIGRPGDGRISSEEIAILHERTEQADTRSGFAATGLPASTPPAGAQGGAAPSGGFPSIGAPTAGGAEAAPASAFPAFGASGGEAGGAGGASAFPAFSATPDEAPAAGFPAFGKPSGGVDEGEGEGEGEGEDAGEVMPALGASPAGEPGAASAFPAFANPATEDGEAGAGAAMPTLGAAPEGGDGAFPSLEVAAEPADGEASEMPGLSAPAEGGEAPSMPALAAPGEDARGVPAGHMLAPDEATTLDAELAATAWGAADAQPAVLGMRLGQERTAVEKTLASLEFGDCEESEARIACARSGETMNEEISVWSSGEGGTWAIVRRIAFAEPAPAEMVRERFRGAYPEIMDAAGMVASRPACTPDMAAAGRLRTLADEAAAIAMSGVEVPEALVDFARRCPLVYRLELAEQGGGGIASATIAFLDASHLLALSRERAAAAAEAEEERRGRLADDLEL